MRTPSAGAVLTALLVVASVAVGPVAGQTGDDAIVTIDVETTPENPDPGDNVTVTTTVESVVDGARTYNIQRVELRESRDSNDSSIDASDAGYTIQGGESASVEVTEEFDQAGEFQRYVHVQMLSPSGEVINLVRPLTVTVEQSHPALSLSAGSVGPDGDATFSLTVANGLPEEVRGVTVDVASEDVSLVDDRRIVSALAAGEQATVDVDATNVSPGTKTIDARLTYVTADGESRTTSQTLATTVGRTDADIRLTDVRVERNGDVLAVRGSASNLGESNVTGVLVAVDESDDLGATEARSEQFVGTVGAGDAADFSVNASIDGADDAVTVPLEVSYLVDGERATATRSIQYTPNERARVTLTDLSLDQSGDVVTISGNASNLGEGNVTGVLVAVGDGDGAGPGANAPESFVGTVGGSDDAPFAVNASLSDVEGTVTIPLAVSYEVGEERVTRERTLEYTPSEPAEVALTGVRVEQRGRELIVRGSASNLGDENATGVVVSAAEGEAVVPAQNQPEYFVGEVPGSDFSSFEVHATLTAMTNESVTIPVTIEYTVDGLDVTRTATVEYTPRVRSDPGQSQQSALGTLGTILPVVGVVVVLIVLALGWRRYR